MIAKKDAITCGAESAINRVSERKRSIYGRAIVLFCVFTKRTSRSNAAFIFDLMICVTLISPILLSCSLMNPGSTNFSKVSQTRPKDYIFLKHFSDVFKTSLENLCSLKMLRKNCNCLLISSWNLKHGQNLRGSTFIVVKNMCFVFSS